MVVVNRLFYNRIVRVGTWRVKRVIYYSALQFTACYRRTRNGCAGTRGSSVGVGSACLPGFHDPAAGVHPEPDIRWLAVDFDGYRRRGETLVRYQRVFRRHYYRSGGIPVTGGRGM